MPLRIERCSLRLESVRCSVLSALAVFFCLGSIPNGSTFTAELPCPDASSRVPHQHGVFHRQASSTCKSPAPICDSGSMSHAHADYCQPCLAPHTEISLPRYLPGWFTPICPSVPVVPHPYEIDVAPRARIYRAPSKYILYLVPPVGLSNFSRARIARRKPPPILPRETPLVQPSPAKFHCRDVTKFLRSVNAVAWGDETPGARCLELFRATFEPCGPRPSYQRQGPAIYRFFVTRGPRSSYRINRFAPRYSI